MNMKGSYDKKPSGTYYYFLQRNDCLYNCWQWKKSDL